MHLACELRYERTAIPTMVRIVTASLNALPSRVESSSLLLFALTHTHIHFRTSDYAQHYTGREDLDNRYQASGHDLSSTAAAGESGGWDERNSGTESQEAIEE